MSVNGQARQGSPPLNNGVLGVVFANKAGSKMSGEVYLLWLLSLLQTVSLLTLKMSSCRRFQKRFIVSTNGCRSRQLRCAVFSFVSRILLRPEPQNDVALSSKPASPDGEVKPPHCLFIS